MILHCHKCNNDVQTKVTELRHLCLEASEVIFTCPDCDTVIKYEDADEVGVSPLEIWGEKFTREEVESAICDISRDFGEDAAVRRVGPYIRECERLEWEESS